LDIETQLEHTTPTRRQWRAWADAQPALRGLDHDRLRDELQAGAQHRKDELLATLVHLAQHGPHPNLAVLVVTACLLPGLRHLIGRYARRLDRQEALQVLVTALCEHIPTFDLDSHPRFVATHLLGLPAGRLRRAVGSERSWASHSRRIPDTPAADTTSGSPVAEPMRLAMTAGVVTASNSWLIHATRVDGLPLRAAACLLNLGYEAAKKRRRRAENRLATWWATDSEPAGRRDGHEQGRAA
jgi:hypothetical protein